MSNQDPQKERPLAEIEEEIATLSATISAATYQLLCLLNEYDKRCGWADPLDPSGFRSLAHWLSWRVGLDLGTAREQVRVARALPQLLKISAAFRRGEVSYSKVRAMTRIATPENEDELMTWAKASTASQLEKLIRSFRQADRRSETAQAQLQEELRGLYTYHDSDGMLRIQGRLTPEQGALFMKALEVSREELTASPDAQPNQGNSEVSDVSDEVDVDMENVSAETSEVSTGQPQTTTRGGSTPKRRMDELFADALARMAERALAKDAQESPSQDRFQVVVHVDAEVLSDPDADGRSELEDGPTISADTARRLACDAAIVEMQHGQKGELTSGRKTRAVSAPLRRALRARDGTRCAYPGCDCKSQEIHHVKHWADGGPTVLTNLTNVCKYHHTLVHEGGHRVEAAPDGHFRFFTPDGREVLPVPPLPAVRDDPQTTLMSKWVPSDVSIDGETPKPSWQGEIPDYAWGVEALFGFKEKTEDSNGNYGCQTGSFDSSG
jgi:hypothetical protein